MCLARTGKIDIVMFSVCVLMFSESRGNGDIDVANFLLSEQYFYSKSLWEGVIRLNSTTQFYVGIMLCHLAIEIRVHQSTHCFRDGSLFKPDITISRRWYSLDRLRRRLMKRFCIIILCLLKILMISTRNLCQNMSSVLRSAFVYATLKNESNNKMVLLFKIAC